MDVVGIWVAKTSAKLLAPNVDRGEGHIAQEHRSTHLRTSAATAAASATTCRTVTQQAGKNRRCVLRSNSAPFARVSDQTRGLEAMLRRAAGSSTIPST